MAHSKIPHLLIFILIVSGCTSVTSPYLVGEKPAVAEPAHWDGRWSPDGPENPVKEELRIVVTDRDKGILRVSSYKAGSETAEDAGDCYLREAGDWMIVNAQDKDEFHPARIKNTGKGVIILWLADFEKFKRLVEKGILPGEIRESNVSLGLLRPEHLKLIISDKEGVLFQWDDPVVLIRRNEKN